MLIIKQSGQSLLELVIAIGVAVAIISGVTILAIQGLQNSQFSQRQIEATKRAQEALELIRSFRANQIPIRIGGISYSWLVNQPPTIWDTNFCAQSDPSQPDFCKMKFVNCPTNCQLIKDPNPEVLPGGYTREVHITNVQPLNANQKKIIVIVKWIDVNGEHQSKLSTILSNY